jgi:hypothetical protein
MMAPGEENLKPNFVRRTVPASRGRLAQGGRTFPSRATTSMLFMPLLARVEMLKKPSWGLPFIFPVWRGWEAPK